MEEEFRKKIDAVSDLATEARKTKKQNSQKKMMAALELCKEHQGPLTSTDIHRLDELTDQQIMTEASYLKKTIAPNLRYKRKEGNKMVNFTLDEIKRQIRDFISPESTVASNLQDLLHSALYKQEETEEILKDIPNQSEVPVNTLGKWQGKLGEIEVGMVVDRGDLQIFKKKRHGMVPSGLLQSVNEWTLLEEIEGYRYEEKNNVIYLVF